MGNTESGPATNDRPIPLALEGASLLERGFYEAAVGKFKRSYELYKESGAHSSAGRSLRLAAEAGLQMAAPDYELAATAFEEVATLYLTNEITAFAAAGVAFSNALLCLLAAGRIATAKGKLVEFSGKLSTFGGSLDGLAATTILEAYQNGNRSQCLDRVQAFKDVLVLPAWRLALLDKIVDRL